MTRKPSKPARPSRVELERAVLEHEKWMRSHDWNASDNKPEEETDRELMLLARRITASKKGR